MDKTQPMDQTVQIAVLRPGQNSSGATVPQLARSRELRPLLASEGGDCTTDDSGNVDSGSVRLVEQQGQTSAPRLGRNARVALQTENTSLDVGQNQRGVTRQTKKRLPHLPDEIGLTVFSQAEAHLNPVRLMALMNVEGKDSIPPFIAHAASDNRFWRPFSPMSHAEPDAAYAPRFVERWNNMPPQHQTLLKSLWDGRLSAVETFEVEPNVQDDFDIVVAAVTQYGWALEHASDALKNDRNIVMAAVSQNGWALEHASDALKAERSVVLTAVNRYGEALRYASDVL